jgi:hypothetical protein
MKPLFNFLRYAAVLLTSLAILSGCGGGGGGGGSATGTLGLSITDQPACGYDHVYITVEKVRFHQSQTAQDSDGGWQEIILTPAKRIDLHSLTNGILETLGQTALPAGKYTQMRLVLASNSVTPLANSVVPTGGSEVALTTPSGQQTGLKMNVDMTVAAGTVADFTIDFDACKSVVKAGNSGRYLLKPVMAVIPIVSDAGQRIVGYLDTSTLGATTNVSAQSGGVVIKATPPDSTGQFVLYPVPAGTYDLVVTSTSHATAVMTGVPVVTTAYTFVGSSSVRIALTMAATHDATGAVSLNASTVDTAATVRATQAVHSGPTIEVASMTADADTGAYAFTLPITAPQVTTYTVNPVSITFAPDSIDASLTAAGKYTLEASISGLTSQTTSINLLGGNAAINFSFTNP